MQDMQRTYIATAAVPRLPVGRRLTARERARLVLEILAAYVDARRAMHRMAIEPAVRALRANRPEDTERGSERELLYEAWRLGRAVERTLRLAPGDTRCLTRSLVLTQLLARRGIPSRLVIGAATEPSFFAHAWVEQAGQPVLPVGDGPLGRLVEL
jgi:transglutaminase-like putative cysteine protease